MLLSFDQSIAAPVIIYVEFCKCDAIEYDWRLRNGNNNGFALNHIDEKIPC